MERALKMWAANRQLYFNFFDQYSLEQLNKIPKGFNNNLIWNIGHIIVFQQSIIYERSNLPMYIEDNLVNLYKPGTKPSGAATQAEMDKLKGLLISLIDKTVTDFQKGIFTTYDERTLRSGFHLSSVQDALSFNNFHEGLHLGYMNSIRKFI